MPDNTSSPPSNGENRHPGGGSKLPSAIALTDAQLDAILAAATPLQPKARDRFLREVA